MLVNTIGEALQRRIPDNLASPQPKSAITAFRQEAHELRAKNVVLHPSEDIDTWG
jgi:type II secretory pathway component PulL